MKMGIKSSLLLKRTIIPITATISFVLFAVLMIILINNSGTKKGVDNSMDTTTSNSSMLALSEEKNSEISKIKEEVVEAKKSKSSSDNIKNESSSTDVMTVIKNNYSKKNDNSTVYVDFSSPDYSEIPYLKKFDMFSCTWAWLDPSSYNTQMDYPSLEAIPSIAKLKPESIRTDLFMGYGGIGGAIGSSPSLNGTSPSEYAKVKELCKRLIANDIHPYFCYFANPIYSDGIGIDGWKKQPNLQKWQELCKNIATYFKNNNFEVMTHEIWNEPDFDTVFYTGTWDDYINLYIAGATGIHTADEYSLIGGVSAAWIQKLWKDGRYTRFLSSVKASQTPLDFVSWHYYGKKGKYQGNTDKNDDLDTYISAARSGLESDSYFSTVQQHLNEFNVTCEGDVYKTEQMPKLVFNVFKKLLSATDITRIAWASALEYDIITPALSLIDPYTFERYSSYKAMWMYARLPVERVYSINKTDGISVLSANDGTRAGVILYDTEGNKKEVTVLLDGLISNTDYEITEYAIGTGVTADKLSDTPKKIKIRNDVSAKDLFHTCTIPANGAVYIEINEANKSAVLDCSSPYADFAVRKDYWYPQRGDNYAFADVNLESMSAVVGGGSVSDSHGSASYVTLKEMKGKTLGVDFTIAGVPKKINSESMLGVTVDYHVNGEYIKKVYFYLNGIDGGMVIPVGTKAIPDIKVMLATSGQKIELDKYAPDGWDGQVMLGFVVNRIGKNNGASIRIT